MPPGRDVVMASPADMVRPPAISVMTRVAVSALLAAVAAAATAPASPCAPKTALPLCRCVATPEQPNPSSTRRRSAMAIRFARPTLIPLNSARYRVPVMPTNVSRAAARGPGANCPFERPSSGWRAATMIG